jgi:protein O-mannosyl-transferase
MAEHRIIEKRSLVLLLAIGLVLLVTAIAHCPSLKNGFVWDDEGYILRNHYIQHMSLKNVWAILTTPIMGNYHPLTLISFAWEYLFFKFDPMPYHLTNIIFHLLNCVIVFYFISRLCHNPAVAFVTALLFGIHPLHVESVAWISERKDVLYAFFYLISLICYLTYLEKEHERRHYFHALFYFLLSVLSKPMAVTLPLVLLLIDYFRDRKISYATIVEKIPFFILSILSGFFTLFAQKLSENSNQAFSFPKSIFVACYGLVFYLHKTLLPIKLAALYRYPADGNLFVHIEYLIAPLVLLLIVLLVVLSTRYTKKAAWGGMFYLATLLPVIQLLPIGMAVASDRYTYVPLIGIFYVFSEVIVWTWNKTLEKPAYLSALFIVLSLAVTAQLVLLTVNSSKVWKNTITLWTNVIRQYPETDVAYNNRGAGYSALGELDKALADFSMTIKINPKYEGVYTNICNAYFMKNQNEQALPQCMKALELNPRVPNTYVTLGDIYSKSDKALSIEMYNKAISLNYPAANSRLCTAYLSVQKYDEAYPACLATLEYYPDDVGTCNRLGNAYLLAGQYKRALGFYARALAIDPSAPETHNSLAVLYYNLRDFQSADEHIKAAISSGYKVNPELKKLIEEQPRK